MNFHIKNEPFLVSKTSDKFYEVIFKYEDGKVWNGCVPSSYKELSLDLQFDQVNAYLERWYDELRYENRANLSKLAVERWGETAPDHTETGKVFLKLLQGNGEWVCRTCGTGKINDQPAARIRDIKKRGYIIATKKRNCTNCNSKTYQDILILITVDSQQRQEYRLPIDASTKERIISVLRYKDAVFDVTRTAREFVIDHKFPSQRWNCVESRNHPNMTVDEIRSKFQLLTNQTNMLKSRFCDECVKNNNRANFMGISWFYIGNEKWSGNALGNEDGCIGCPWYDVELWRKLAIEKLKA